MALPGLVQASACEKNIPPVNPASIYIDHGNGTVTDTRTGLMWKKCLEGRTGADCAVGAEAVMNWGTALGHAEAHSFGGYGDWRLPNLKELRSLVEECRANPAVNAGVFPGSSSSYVWSGSPHAYNKSNAWSVNFYYGDSSDYFRSSVSLVRLVRTDQAFALLKDERPTDGMCGAAAGVPATAEPVSQLCSVGVATAVNSAGGVYRWQCAGEHGGIADQCSAPQAGVPATLAGTGGVFDSLLADVAALPRWLQLTLAGLLLLVLVAVSKRQRKK